MPEFLRETGVALDELYRSPGWTWTRLRREAGLPTAASGAREDQLSKALPRLLHMDDGSRLAVLSASVEGHHTAQSTAAFQESERRILLGLHFTLWGSTWGLSSLDASMAQLWAHPAILSDIRELLDLLEDQSRHLTFPMDGAGALGAVPLSVHASYSLDEILTAVGEIRWRTHIGFARYEVERRDKQRLVLCDARKE